MASKDPLKRLGEKIGKEVAEGVADVVKKATKPKPKSTKPKTTKSTSPTRTPRVTPPVRPTPKVDLPSTKVTPPTRKPRTPKVETPAAVTPPARTKVKPKATKPVTTKPTATPKPQTKKTKPTADLEAPKTKKAPAKKKSVKEKPVVTTAPTPAGGYMDDALGDEFALGRAAQEATQEAADAAAAAGARATDEVAGGVGTVTDEVTENVIDTARRRRIPRPTARGTAVGISTTALPALQLYEAGTGNEAPEWLKNTAAIAGLAGGYAGLKGFRGAGVLGKGLRGLGLLGSAAVSLPQLMGGGGQPTEAVATTPIIEEQAVTPEEMFPGYAPEEGVAGPSPEEEYLQTLEEAIADMTEEADAAAESDAAAVESAADQALADLIAAYGGEGNASAAAAAGDPILLQQLAAIEADYTAGMSQISNNYGAALTQINGYTQQANALYNDLAAKQGAAFAATSGALESGGIPLGLTAGEAAMSGLSDTALGGAGITGAALNRMIGEAGQAGIRADQGAIGIDLGTAAAEARLGQADLQAALGRDYLGAKSDARTAAAERAAAEREAQKERAMQLALLKYEREVQKEQDAADKAERDAERRRQIAQWNAQTQLDLAEMVAGMSAEEYARWKGSSSGKGAFKAPAWYGKTLKGDPNQVVGGLKLSTLPATVQSVNDVLDIIYATMSSEAARNPATALTEWQKLYETLDADTKKILASRGIPTTATGMYKELFKSAPSK